MWIVLAALGYLVLVKPAKKPCSCSVDPSCCADKPQSKGRADALSGARLMAPDLLQVKPPDEQGEGELLGRRGSDEGTVFSGEPEPETAPEPAVEAEPAQPMAPGSTASSSTLLTRGSASPSQTAKTAAISAARVPPRPSPARSSTPAPATKPVASISSQMKKTLAARGSRAYR